jgi:hypothetical protein
MFNELQVFRGQCSVWAFNASEKITSRLEYLQKKYPSEKAQWYIQMAKQELLCAKINGIHNAGEDHALKHQKYYSLKEDVKFEEEREQFCRNCVQDLSEHVCSVYGCNAYHNKPVCDKHYVMCFKWWVNEKNID